MSGVKLIFVNFDLVKEVLFFSSQFINIPASIKSICDSTSYDEKTTRKILLNIALIPKAENWCSKDADLQAKTTGIIFYMYKKCEDIIKKTLHSCCETCTDYTQNNLMTEGDYKNAVDTLMEMNKVFGYFDDVEYGEEPMGEWSVKNNITSLKLRYTSITSIIL